MVAVEGGSFTMGATSEQGGDAWDNEKPAHNVTLSDYMIAKTEVTQGLWIAVMGTNPSYFKGYDLPVESVSWDDCQEFIKKLNSITGFNFRLPTEAEWEYAARGGNKSKGYKYSGSDNLGSVAWYYENSGISILDEDNWVSDIKKTNKNQTHIVAIKLPNELGIYDMSGNVDEWCSDYWWGSYSSDSQIDPKGPSSGYYRVHRGGNWYEYSRRCRVSYRNYYRHDDKWYYLGLRLAL
ncbi:MAG: formylglycine-generating enzyme family protein [Muribaculaceae bacterium]|nr:formylglycine-generating enzyme family protein [Muribaculaceae bacterium]